MVFRSKKPERYSGILEGWNGWTSSIRKMNFVLNLLELRPKGMCLSSFIRYGYSPMTKKRHASSAPVRQTAKSVKPIPDSQIDYSDIPESTDEELKRARRVGRPKTGYAKHLIAIRVSPRVLDLLRRQALKNKKPYQTYIHEILERAANKSAA